MSQADNHLIIFSRYPKPGDAKTRLIPALGPQRAAQLQREMTGRTVLTARSSMAAGRLTIYYHQGSAAAMRAWLGAHTDYSKQPAGDLGQRMAHAFAYSFDRGSSRSVLIGTDVPGITRELLSAAYEALHSHDLVIGPALDGGYYLLGMRTVHNGLFQNMAWGSSTVLNDTLARAEALKLKVHMLETLSDVDSPDDLGVWEAVRPQWPEAATDIGISVIIPTLNEAAQIADTLRAVRATPCEVLVVDGGSHDATCAIAREAGARVVSAPCGRADQMNLGAQQATGHALLFLHADTLLPPTFGACVRETLCDADVALGAFSLKIADSTRRHRFISRMANWRARALRLPYGDQALFMRRSVFCELGGYTPLPIMEDYDLVRRLARRGSVRCIAAEVTTSARRWNSLGVVKTTLRNQRVLAGYLLGEPPEHLRRLYRRKPESKETPFDSCE